MIRRLSLLLLLVPSLAFGQTNASSDARSLLLRNISGTAANPGPVPHNTLLRSSGGWSAFFGGAVFATTVTATGENLPDQQAFSTNWLAFGAQRELGSRGLLLFRARGSAEPFTVPEEGYAQLMQVVPPSSGGPLVDRMRARNLIGEAAADLALRLGSTGFAHVYVGAVGDPALGAVPFAQRTSSEEFAEAPFGYAIQESLHEASRVVTAGLGSRSATIEGSIFHHMVTTGRHSSIDDGDIDSWSARITLNPTQNTSLQYSQGKLGPDNLPVTTASASYGNGTFATTAIWTRRDMLEPCPAVCPAVVPKATARNSAALEALLRPGGAFTFMIRAETMDNLLATVLPLDPLEKRTHITFGAIYDLVRPKSFRGGIGVNLDYHTRTKMLEAHYGHKPQTIYAFLRLRTNRR